MKNKPAIEKKEKTMFSENEKIIYIEISLQLKVNFDGKITFSQVKKYFKKEFEKVNSNEKIEILNGLQFSHLFSNDNVSYSEKDGFFNY